MSVPGTHSSKYGIYIHKITLYLLQNNTKQKMLGFQNTRLICDKLFANG